MGSRPQTRLDAYTKYGRVFVHAAAEWKLCYASLVSQLFTKYTQGPSLDTEL